MDDSDERLPSRARQPSLLDHDNFDANAQLFEELNLPDSISEVLPMVQQTPPLVQFSPRSSSSRQSAIIKSPPRAYSPILKTSPTKASMELSNKSVHSNRSSSKRLSIQENQIVRNIGEEISNLEPRGNIISNFVNELSETVKNISDKNMEPKKTDSNINKIATMSKILTKEANDLRQSIKCLCEDIEKTKEELNYAKQDVNFPYHLFLIELIINKINMKCECLDLDYNNLVITATFLGKQPIVLYDSSYGKIENFNKLNVGKSTLFAMTYDKICCINDFEVTLLLTKKPPCTSCVTKIGETHMDYTQEFICLREELCEKWAKEQPKDNILCTTSTPLTKNMYYLSCGDSEHSDSVGVIEVTARMSFLGKEITTAFCASPKPQGTSFLLKQDNGMTMYSCQKVELDDQGKILLDEEVLAKKAQPLHTRRTESPISQMSSLLSGKHGYTDPYGHLRGQDGMPRYDEIFTKMNDNELKIRVPKSTRVERMGKYDRIQELCSCESTPYNAGEQIQFEMPPDVCRPDKQHNTYTSNLKYTYRGCDRANEVAGKDRKIINVTPTNCPVPVDMQKMVHPLKDVFILKIGKKLETKDKKTDLEIELITPKIPSEKPAEQINTASQQCSVENLKKKPSKTKQKKKGKGKAKAKKK